MRNVSVKWMVILLPVNLSLGRTGPMCSLLGGAHGESYHDQCMRQIGLDSDCKHQGDGYEKNSGIVAEYPVMPTLMPETKPQHGREWIEG